MTLMQEERWSTFHPACLPLFKEHNEEIGEPEDRMPLDPDVDAIEALDKAGMLQILTARHSDDLLGYCTFVISKSLQSKNVLCATQSIYFVKKCERKGSLGLRLYMESIRHLKTKGVKNIYPHHWLRGDSIALKPFFERMGAIEVEHVYSLWIGE